MTIYSNKTVKIIYNNYSKSIHNTVDHIHLYVILAYFCLLVVDLEEC